ncbi:hypothetical protein KC973_02795 [Candidatus Saccharibacteria bacterium]|nr:hypothetical protein [Candidatus Saccharibacteria bacterium]
MRKISTTDLVELPELEHQQAARLIQLLENRLLELKTHADQIKQQAAGGTYSVETGATNEL